MNVMRILSATIKKGIVLNTPSQNKPFEVAYVSNNEVVLLLGSSKSKTPIPSGCWNGIIAFLKGKGWVEIGAIHSVTGKPGTLEDYINNHKPVSRSTGNYVAAVLEYADIIEIDRRRPNKVRLKSSINLK